MLLPERTPDRGALPFDPPWLTDGLTLDFTGPVTIIADENGNSTLIKAIGALAVYDQAGGDNGCRPVDHATALAASAPLRRRLTRRLAAHGDKWLVLQGPSPSSRSPAIWTTPHANA